MTRGEMPLKPLPIGRSDEVGHLTEAFNRLLVKLQSSQAELARMAHHDALTGLPNRTMLADRLRQALARAYRNGDRLAVLFLDLDGFKPINDAHGHEAGDQALAEVARRLLHVVRETDTLARVGGDEFVIMMADLDRDQGAAIEAARAVAAKCADALRTPINVLGHQCQLGASIGIALGDGQSTAHNLISMADNAMYKVKQTGRGHAEFVIDISHKAPSAA
jgi:diguanylate cyclase (GGDEF)-like protein